MLRIRILLVDDNAEFLDSATSFLKADPRLEIVGLAVSGAQALEKVDELHPDLILMDWAMPEMPGPVVLRRLKARPNCPRIVMVTLYDNPEYREIARLAYADGFVAKAEFGSNMLPLIHELFGNASQALVPSTAG